MEELLVNGIHAKSGRALLAGLTLDDIARIAMGFNANPATLPDLYGQSRRNSGDQKRSPVEGIDPDNLAQAGWGVVFAASMDAEKEALQPLLALRHEQAGDRYREFSSPETAFKAGENKRTFLKTRGAASTGPVEPGKMPYYLLLVGSPEQIPFEVQYELDIQYAVGRIHFDSVEDYSRYAKAVVAAETGTVTVPPRAAFVGVQHWWDPATRLSANRLVKPLASSLGTARLDWSVETFCEEDAHKSNLLSLLQRDQPPALLFTASHGIGYDHGDPDQYAYQGALLMQDFSGSLPVPLEECFTANDAKVLKTPGMISFHFACFGAGTPAANNFYGYSQCEPGRNQTIAPKPFLAALPKQMLANGALASVGHIDTAFATTFVQGASTAAYDSTLKRLAAGGRIGLAMDYFNLRHAELSVGLTVALDEEQRRQPEAVADLAHRWLQNNDARNFIVVGDPAVRLPLKSDPAIEAEQLRRRISGMESELARLKERLQQLSGS